jgi:hypothetical protein
MVEGNVIAAQQFMDAHCILLQICEWWGFDECHIQTKTQTSIGSYHGALKRLSSLETKGF